MAVLFVLIGSSFISGIGGPTQVDTSQAISDIQSNKVDTATIVDRDQILDLTLKDATKREKLLGELNSEDDFEKISELGKISTKTRKNRCS